LHKVPEQRVSHLHLGRSLISHLLFLTTILHSVSFKENRHIDDSSFILVRCLPIDRNSVNLMSVFIYGFVYSGFECDWAEKWFAFIEYIIPYILLGLCLIFQYRPHSIRFFSHTINLKA
jgi:hypothetical protein